MIRPIWLAAFVAVLVSTPAYAALVLSQNDSESAAIYQNGGGNGFGGTLGGGGITMDVQGTNLVVGLNQGSTLNDIVGLFLDTRAGGFIDAQMDDQADGVASRPFKSHTQWRRFLSRRCVA